MATKGTRAGRAAGVAVVLALLGACGSEGDVGQPPAGEIGTPAPPTTVPTDYHRHQAVIEIGPGLVEGASPDGSAVYVSAIESTSPPRGCDGQPQPRLFRVPLNGDARELIAGSGTSIQGTMVRRSNGRVAILAGCEGILPSVHVGRETADGRLRDVRSLQITADGSSILDVAWAADGESLLVGRTRSLRLQRSDVVRVDTASGRVTPLFEVDGILEQVGEMADGTFVTTNNGGVTLRDGTGAARATIEGRGFTLAPDRRSVVTWGARLLLVTDPRVGPFELATPHHVGLMGPAAFSPDGRAVAYTTTADAGEISVVTVADRRVSTLPLAPARYHRLAFMGDGEALAFSRLGSSPADAPTALVSRFA